MLTYTLTPTEEEEENPFVAVEKPGPHPSWDAPDRLFGIAIVWENTIGIIFIHIMFIYGLFIFPYMSKPWVGVWLASAMFYSGIGILGGVHRMWSHRSYKGKLGVRIFFMICYMSTGMNSMRNWIRDHRIHHKYSETDADPHDARRGFFFSHCGWLMLQKHPEVYKKGANILMDDVMADPVVQFAEKYFNWLRLVFAYLLHLVILNYLIGISFGHSIIFIAGKQALVVNAAWAVNSVAHLWGTRPYNKAIYSCENSAFALYTMGESWHNYHHTFPWDYKASEVGKLNVMTSILQKFAKWGWVYDLKEPSKELLVKVLRKHGDGTYDWGDQEVPEEMCDVALVKNF